MDLERVRGEDPEARRCGVLEISEIQPLGCPAPLFQFLVACDNSAYWRRVTIRSPMLRRVHLVVGIAAVVAFLLSGQLLGHHHHTMEQLPGEVRMMYVSRHIYLLAGALVNAVVGLYLHLLPSGWRRLLQVIGSIFILISVLLLSMAFLTEPPHGMAG